MQQRKRKVDAQLPFCCPLLEMPTRHFGTPGLEDPPTYSMRRNCTTLHVRNARTRGRASKFAPSSGLQVGRRYYLEIVCRKAALLTDRVRMVTHSAANRLRLIFAHSELQTAHTHPATRRRAERAPPCSLQTVLCNRNFPHSHRSQRMHATTPCTLLSLLATHTMPASNAHLNCCGLSFGARFATSRSKICMWQCACVYMSGTWEYRTTETIGRRGALALHCGRAAVMKTLERAEMLNHLFFPFI